MHAAEMAIVITPLEFAAASMDGDPTLMLHCTKLQTVLPGFAVMHHCPEKVYFVKIFLGYRSAHLVQRGHRFLRLVT